MGVIEQEYQFGWEKSCTINSFYKNRIFVDFSGHVIPQIKCFMTLDASAHSVCKLTGEMFLFL